MKKKPSKTTKPRPLGKHNVGSSATYTRDEKVNSKMREAISALIEFCHIKNLDNPKITMIAEIEREGKYKLVFERTDLD